MHLNKYRHSFVAILGLFIFACSTKAYAETELRVGLAIPLTGVAAEYGLAYKNGFELALNEDAWLKAHLKVTYEDHQYDSKQSLSAVRKLDASDGVQVIYVWGFTPSDVVAPTSDSIKAPLLLASINPISKGKSDVLNIESSIETLMDPLAESLKAANYDRIAFVVTQLGALVSGADIVKASLPKESIVSTDVLETAASDFRSIITRLKSKKVNAVGLFLAPAQMTQFITQARALGFTPALYGGNTFNDAEVLALFKDEKEGPVFVDSYLDPTFSKKYLEMHHTLSHINEAARGHFLAGLLKHVTQQAVDGSAEQILSALHSYPPGTGAAGSYVLIEDPNFGWHVDFKPTLNRISSGTIIAETATR